MKVCLAFSQTSDGRFLVMSTVGTAFAPDPRGDFMLATYDHEDTFLRLVIEAEVEPEDAARVATVVLLSISAPVYPQRWVEVELNAVQREKLGLRNVRRESQPDAELYAKAFVHGAVFEFVSDAQQFHDFLMQAPTPFVMLSGPLHQVTFINPPYVRLFGQARQEEILGKTIREVVPELEGQVFFSLLDEVYKTGVPYVGDEVHAYMRRRHSTELEDRYFDFIYHPVWNSSGEVTGIMVQAADVTERVLARQVSEQREEQLYSQWAEIDAIYRTSPVGMALFDARSLRVLRMNQKHAELMGASADELIGKSVLEVSSSHPRFVELIQQAAKGERVGKTIVRQDVSSSVTRRQSWVVNITPALGASGEVTAVSSIFLGVADVN